MENNEQNQPGNEQPLVPATGAELTTPADETVKETSADDVEIPAPAEETVNETSATDVEIPASPDETVNETSTEHLSEHDDENLDDQHPEEDFQALGKDELLKKMEDAFGSAEPEKMRHVVQKLKEVYRQLAREALENKRRAWEETKEEESDTFMPAVDPRDERFEEYVRKYNIKRTEFRRDREKVLKQNLQVKLTIIEELKQLHETSDSMQKAFDKLQDLQNRWKDAGPVPHGYADDLWKSYHHHIDRFYDVVKISRELRDLDMKKNQEAKEELLAKAEALTGEDQLKDALNKLRDIHVKWREIGPAVKEVNDALWEKLRTASDKVHARRLEMEAKFDEQRKANLLVKLALCEEIEKFSGTVYDSHKGWQDGNKICDEIFERWRKVGFVPKEDEDKTWKRFKQARNLFFQNREVFYGKQRDESKTNYDAKIALCEEAEKLMVSTDWKRTADAFKRLQDKWKAVGPVSRKVSDKIWKRFKTAADTFFENRNKQFAAADAALLDNVKTREQFIADMANVQLTDDMKASKATIAKLQDDWNALGEMPRNEKNRVENAFREALAKVFEQLKEKAGGDENVLLRLKYEQLGQTEKGREQIYRERMNAHDKIKKLQTEINTLENNIGFFGKSKGAQSLVTDYQQKIDSAKAEVEKLKALLKTIPREQ